MTVDLLLDWLWRAHDRYRRLPYGVLVAIRVAVILCFCAVLATFAGMLGDGPR